MRKLIHCKRHAEPFNRPRLWRAPVHFCLYIVDVSWCDTGDAAPKRWGRLLSPEEQGRAEG